MAEVVLREQIAELVAEPLKVTINGVATIDSSANVAALERQLTQLQKALPPDAPAATTTNPITTVQLSARNRR